MQPSNFGDFNSGFSGLSARGANVSVSSPSVSRTSRPGIRRPRLLKVKKQSGSQIPEPAAGTGEEPGLNPFRPVLGRVEPSFSVFSQPRPGLGENEAFAFAASRSDLGDKRVFEGIKNLRIGCENEALNSNSNVSDITGFVFGRDRSKSSVIDVKFEKLSIDDSRQFAGGKSKLSADSEVKFGLRSGGNVDDTATGKSDFSSLSYELKKKLNVAMNGDSDNGGGGGKGTFGASDRKMFELKSDGMDRDMLAKTSENLLPDQIKNLSIKDQADANNAGTRTNEKDSDVYGSRERATGCGGGERETRQSNEMGCKINLESMAGESSHHADAVFSSSQLSAKDMQTGKKGAMKFPVCVEGFQTEFIFKGGLQDNDTSGSQVPIGQPNVDTQTDLSSGGLAGGTTFGVPPTRRPEKPDVFSFTSKQDNVQSPFAEFKTPNQTGILFSSQKPEFGAKLKDSKVKKKRGKLKQTTKVHLWPGHDFVFNASSSQEVPQVSESFSPMDISPYEVIASESHLSRETSVTSEELFSHDDQYASAGSQQNVMSDAIDKDLAAVTQRMTINGEDVLCGGTEQDSSKHFSDKVTGVESYPEESISGAETESFKSANKELDFINEGAVTSAENEASLSTNIERQGSGIWTQFGSAASSECIGGSGFTFAASSSGKALPKRCQKKKDSRAKAVRDSCHFTKNTQFQDASSSLWFCPLSTSSLPLPPEDEKKSGNSHGTVGDNSEVLGQESRKESFSTASASTAAQEVCEKWRLRGNQAYKDGHLLKAEECYTQGLNCISRSETSRSYLRALMLCYSNRAATLMSLGRMRDALQDCQAAADIDPSFLRVQVRAANCHLALGEVEHALQYFSKCLQLGTDACVDRKIAVEASEGLQKAQKVLKFVQHSAELLQRKTSDDAARALEVIVEALSISLYSEKLLEMKAESLFMLRKYEDVIQLCEQTFDLAKKNSPSAHANCQLTNADDSELTVNSPFQLWRCCLIVKSYFYLGKLEEAIGSLEKHDKFNTKSQPTNGNKTLESSIPLTATVQELLQHKTAGNEAFQAGRHSEAIEHYTAALSLNVESRPFAAICFCNRAAAYKALGQITDAIADCSLAIALDGNYLKAISRRATLYEMIRDYGQSATNLQRLVAALTKQVEEKANQSGMSDRSTNLANDLRQAHLRLSTIEEASRNDTPLDMYLILGIQPSASAAEIKKAYRKAALRHHPDKAGQALARSENADDGLWKEIGEEVHKDADRLFKMIGEAYAVLSDPTKRSQYDLEDEMRNALKKHNGSSTYRMHMDAQNYPFERTGSRRQWRKVWRSYGR